MYNMYDEENLNIEEQIIYYIDNDDIENIEEQEELYLPELTEEYLKQQEKLSANEKDIIIFKDNNKKKIYEGTVVGHSTKNDGKFLFSVIEYNSSDITPVNKIFSLCNIERYNLD